MSTANGARYTLAVMKVPSRGTGDERFDQLVDRTIAALQRRLGSLQLDLQSFTVEGASLTSAGGRLQPLDYLEFGLAEKLERGANFLLIVTEADLDADRIPYVVAYPSRLTNIGLVSVRRLLTEHQGLPRDDEAVVKRLVSLMLHTFGHILNLEHHESTTNVMHDFGFVDALDAMSQLTDGQMSQIQRNLEIEAHDERARGSSIGFWWKHVSANRRVIAGTLLRSNPLRLIPKLPTFITAALSAVVVLFFSAEVWDVADAVQAYQIVLFTSLATAVATFVLYRTFAFGTLLDRQGLASESTVVTQTTTFLAVLLTVLTLLLLFFGLAFLAAVTIFPEELMSRWVSAEAADDVVDHVKLSLFLASIAMLTGSLGGRGDSKLLVRAVLFLDEQT